MEKSRKNKQKEIDDKAVNFVVNEYEPSEGRKAKDVRPDKSGYDVESNGRHIEVKGTEKNVPGPTGHHIILLPRQYKTMRKNPDYWIYRVYNVGSKGKEKVVPIPRNEILLHITSYIVHKLVLKKEDWKRLEKKSQK